MHLSRSENCIRLGCNHMRNFCHFFAVWTYSCFGSTSTNAYIQWISCEFHSFYNFSRIFRKFFMCFCQGLKLCIKFGCNPQMNICHIFFCSLSLENFGSTATKAYIHLVSCERNSYNCTPIFLTLCRCFVKVCRCAWVLAVILWLKRVWMGYND